MRRSSTNSGAAAKNKKRDENARLTQFGKLWEEGVSLHAFYPIFELADEDGNPTGEYDILAVDAYGYSIDPKQIQAGRIFLKSISPIEKGKPVKPDILWSASKIMRIIMQSMKLTEINEASEELEDSKAELAQRLVEIETTYKDKQSPFSALKNPISTECAVIRLKPVTRMNPETKQEESRMEPDMNPEVSTLAQQDLSGNRIEVLTRVCNEGRFYVHKDLEVLEVRYSFPRKGDKKQSGRAEPEGLMKEESLLYKYPDKASEIKSIIKRIAEDDKVMFGRQRNFEDIDEGRVMAALSTFFRKNAKHLTNALADAEKKVLAYHQDFFKTFKIKLTDKELEASVKVFADKFAEEEAARQAELDSLEEAPTLEELQKSEMEADVEAAAEAHEAAEEEGFGEFADMGN